MFSCEVFRSLGHRFWSNVGATRTGQDGQDGQDLGHRLWGLASSSWRRISARSSWQALSLSHHLGTGNWCRNGCQYCIPVAGWSLKWVKFWGTPHFGKTRNVLLDTYRTSWNDNDKQDGPGVPWVSSWIGSGNLPPMPAHVTCRLAALSSVLSFLPLILTAITFFVMPWPWRFWSNSLMVHLLKVWCTDPGWWW